MIVWNANTKGKKDPNRFFLQKHKSFLYKIDDCMERIAEPGNGNDDDLDRIERCASPLSMDVERGKLKLQLLKVPFIYYVSTFLGFLSPLPLTK